MAGFFRKVQQFISRLRPGHDLDDDPSEGARDTRNVEVASFSIPGAFPPSPSLDRQHLQAPNELPDDQIPTERLEIDDSDNYPTLELRTELAPHLRPLQSTHTPSPKRVEPPSSAPAKAIPKPALQDDVDIQDPWMRRSMAHGRLPFGAHVSAVQLFSPEKKPIPLHRLPSIYTSAWEAHERERKAFEQDQLRPHRIKPQGPAVRQLSLEWLNRVSDAMRSSQGCAVAKTSTGDGLYPRDIATCLKTLSWLNDEIINSYLSILVQYLRDSTGNGPNERPRFHAFNTFFYTTLRDKGYQGVRRWATRAKVGGEGLLNVKTVFIPVHESSHWTLLVIRPEDRAIEYFDSLDRMGRQGARQVKNIKEWLRGELGARYDDDEWNVIQSVSSQQDNGSDCGVFLLTNAKAIALGIEPTAFGPSDTKNLRKKIVAELMNGGLHGDFWPVDKMGVTLL